MADRYLIGTGARNWNDASNWSGTSGGSGGESVPTLADNAIFDANSGTGTITVNANAACADLTISNLAGALTISGSVYTFNVYGNLTLPATNLTWNFTGTSYLFLKATTSVNITMGATTGRSFNRLYFDGVGGTWTNQDEMNIGSSTIEPRYGTWITNNKNINSGSWGGNTSQPSKGIDIYLGSSIIIISGTIINLRFSANLYPETSKVTCDSIQFDTYSWNEVTINCQNSACTSNTATVNKLIVNGSSTLSSTLTIYASLEIVSELILFGVNSSNYRLLIASNTIGTPRTITCNGTITASNVDFRDITLAGTANRDLSAISGGSGDCGGNSGITFTPAVPQYYKHIGGGTTLWSDATKWFSDSALTVAGRVPLPQDDATFDATSFDANCTLQVDCPRIGRSLDMSGVNQAVTFALANSIECYGSYVLGQNITHSITGFSVNLFGIGNFILNTYEKPLYWIKIYANGGIYVNQSNIICKGVSNGAFKVEIGTFYLNGYNLSTYSFQNTTAGATMYFGNGLIELIQSTVAPFSITSGFNLFAENSTIKLNPASGSTNLGFAGGGKTFNKVQFSGSHTGNFDITGSNTIAELIIDAGRKVRFSAGTTSTIAKLTNNGAAGNLTTIGSTTTTKANIVLPTVQNIDYANISYINVTQPNKLFAGMNSVDGTNNVNVNFNAVAQVVPDIAFTEIEVLESTPLSLAKTKATLTEKESIDINSVLTKAFTNGSFTEIENAAINFVMWAFVSANLTEKEQMQAVIAAKAFISAGFTEKETLRHMIAEAIAGVSDFTFEINGTSNFL